MTVQSPAGESTAAAKALAGAERAPLIELLNVSKSFATGNQSPVTILDRVNLQVSEGEMLALLGQSGSGKSTILRLMAGLAQPTSGQVHYHGQVLTGVNRGLSIVFQSFALYPWLTVSENVEIGLTGQKLSRQKQEEEVERALELIGLSGYENAYPKELSGGMRQRVGFARAIVARPEVLCMDEAFSALDVLTAENLRTEVVNLWQDRRSEQSTLKSIFFVTHNIAEAVFMATRIVIISSHPGRIKHVIENPLAYPRDVNSKGFQALVDQIHAAIVALALPDEPVHVPAPAQTREEQRQTPSQAAPARPVHVESIPQVSIGRISGLLEILEDSTETVDLFELSHQIGKEFSDTISIVKAAEMLDLVDTPKQEVFLTVLGREFLAADQAERKAIFARQILKLRLFQIITGSLRKTGKPVDADIILQELAILLPYDNPEKLFETIIAWGRYAELIDYDQDTHTVFVQEEEAAAEAES
jgi:NitT/TauT family transport system ATP-binding protein